MKSNMSLGESLKHDIPASVVVFLVALPLCLGIALASGAPLFSGLIAGIVGGIVVGALSGSRLGVSGPAAGLAVIVFAAINSLGSFEAFLVAVVLAGLLQLAMGYLRAGVIGYYFPSSVIKGMLSGIGLTIILKQLPHAVGYDANPEGDMAFVQSNGENTLSALGTMLSQLQPGALVVGLVPMLGGVFSGGPQSAALWAEAGVAWLLLRSRPVLGGSAITRELLIVPMAAGVTVVGSVVEPITATPLAVPCSVVAPTTPVGVPRSPSGLSPWRIAAKSEMPSLLVSMERGLLSIANSTSSGKPS